MSGPRQGTGERSELLSQLSRPDLAREFVRADRKSRYYQRILDEFNRRFWAEQEERAAAGSQLRLPPPWRPLQ